MPLLPSATKVQPEYVAFCTGQEGRIVDSHGLYLIRLQQVPATTEQAWIRYEWVGGADLR
jgi:hypothetical protein